MENFSPSQFGPRSQGKMAYKVEFILKPTIELQLQVSALQSERWEFHYTYVMFQIGYMKNHNLSSLASSFFFSFLFFYGCTCKSL